MKETAVDGGREFQSVSAIERNLVRPYGGGWDSFGASEEVKVGRVIRRAPLVAGKYDSGVKLGVLRPNPEPHDVPLTDGCHGFGVKLAGAELASATMGSVSSQLK